MVHYIIQTITFQIFFLLVYDVFLKKDTFFNWNRVYLIVTMLLSITLPFIEIDSFKNVLPQDYIITLPEIILGESPTNTIIPVVETEVVTTHNKLSLWYILFCLGVLITSSLFVYKLTKLLRLAYKNPKTYRGKLKFVSLKNSNVAFSFFRYVFLGTLLKKEEKQSILKHELVHVKQCHSADLLFFELLRILFWFNPFIYVYQNRMVTLHEFIADAEAIKRQDKSHYYQNLLAQIFETKKISFINPFFKQSLIKKRILMLQKTKSKQINLLKYALLLPMVLGMLIYTSCQVEDDLTKEIDLSQYNYTFEFGEKITDDKKIIREKYEAFLKDNPDYVSWVQIDNKNRLVYFSVHHENEKVPDSLSKINVDGSYVRYVNSPKPVFVSKEKPIKQDEEQVDMVNKVEVPISVIEQVPLYPECESLTKEEQRKCVSNLIQKHVNANFNTKIATKNNLKGRQRINVIFKISHEGNIIDVRSRASHPALEAEAIRVVKALPKMIPGKQKGKTVNVPYSLPIIFQIK